MINYVIYYIIVLLFFMVRVMCGVLLKDNKRANDLMLMLGLNKIKDNQAIANSVHWHGHVLWKKWSCYLKGIRI